MGNTTVTQRTARELDAALKVFRTGWDLPDVWFNDSGFAFRKMDGKVGLYATVTDRREPRDYPIEIEERDLRHPKWAVESLKEQLDHIRDVIHARRDPAHRVALLLEDAAKRLRHKRYSASEVPIIEMVADAWTQLEAGVPAAKRRAPAKEEEPDRAALLQHIGAQLREQEVALAQRLGRPLGAYIYALVSPWTERTLQEQEGALVEPHGFAPLYLYLAFCRAHVVTSDLIADGEAALVERTPWTERVFKVWQWENS